MKVVDLEASFYFDDDGYIADMQRIILDKKDFTQVVLEGINVIQKWQRREAPVGSGPGSHRRIPRSIEAGRIMRKNNIVSGTSRTSYVPAIVTSEGSGKWGPRASEYPIQRGSRTWYHPGVRGTNWWDKGAIKGEGVALRAFKRKVEEILNLRGAF